MKAGTPGCWSNVGCGTDNRGRTRPEAPAIRFTGVRRSLTRMKSAPPRGMGPTRLVRGRSHGPAIGVVGPET
jgi:hypothetical protein